MACERGVSFGYNNLVSDMRSLAIMRETACARRLRRDALGAVAGRAGHEFRRPARVRAGARARRGRNGRRGSLHGDASGPGSAKSDGPNAVPLHRMEALLETLVALDQAVKRGPFLENDFN